MKNYEGEQPKLYEVIVETKELHRLESTGYDEQEAKRWVCLKNLEHSVLMCEKETYHGDLFLNLNDEVKKTSRCKEIKEWRLRQQQYLLLQLTKIVHK